MILFYRVVLVVGNSVAHFSCLYAVDQGYAYMVGDAVLTNHWQHLTWSFFLHHSVNTDLQVQSLKRPNRKIFALLIGPALPVRVIENRK